MSDQPEATPEIPPIPNLIASFSIDLRDPRNPVVVFRLENAGVGTEFRIDARKAGHFGAGIAQGMAQTAAHALAAAGPQLIAANPDGSPLVFPRRDPGATLRGTLLP